MALNVDYAAGQRFIADFFVDACVVTRTPLQQFSGPLDTRTGLRLLPNTPTDPQLLYQGPCLFQRRATADAPEELAEELLNIPDFTILFPDSFQTARLRDTVVVTVSREPMLIGHSMRVLDVMAITHHVYRGVFARDMTAARSLYERD